MQLGPGKSPWEGACDGTAVLARRGSPGDALEHVLMVLMGMCGEREG